MHNCVQRLLFGGEQQHDNDYMPAPEEIEVLWKLMLTVGKQLDHDKAGRYMGHYFWKIGLVAQRCDSQRHKFLLTDVLELRERGWSLGKSQAAQLAKAHKLAKGENQFSSFDLGRENSGRFNL